MRTDVIIHLHNCGNTTDPFKTLRPRGLRPISGDLD